MFKFGKSSANLRVPEVLSIPETGDLQFVLSKAQRNWRTSVELPFRAQDSPVAFIVVVKCEMGTGAPWWTLFRCDVPGSPTLWTHQSSDVLLIHNLIALEWTAALASPGQLPQESAQMSALSADATSPGTSTASPPEPTPGKAEPVSAQSAGRNPYLARLQELGKYGSVDGETDTEADRAMAAPSVQLEPRKEEDSFSDQSYLALPLSEQFRQARESVENCLSRSETSILNYSAFLYFLDNECVRFNRGGEPFSILLFDLLHATDFGLKPVSPIVMWEAGSRLRHLKRQLDVLAHYRDDGYAFILPHTDGVGARTFAGRVEASLRSDEELVPGLESSSLIFSFGIASMPEHGTQAEELLKTALEAKGVS